MSRQSPDTDHIVSHSRTPTVTLATITRHAIEPITYYNKYVKFFTHPDVDRQANKHIARIMIITLSTEVFT
jgi:hypothetical protein